MTPADRAAAAAAAAGPSGTQSRRAAGVSVSRPAGGATRARSAPRSLLSLVPGPRSLPWRAEEALSLGEAFPAPYRTDGRGGMGRLPEKQSREIRVARREPWLLHPSSLRAERGGRQPSRGWRSLPPWFRAHPHHPFLPLPLRGGGFRTSLRGEPRSRLVGSCEVCGGAGEFFFTGGGNESHPLLHRGRQGRGNSGRLD